MLGIIFVYLQKILLVMRLNFNTIIYPIYGCLIGVNYWNSLMEHVVIESAAEDADEHCLEFHLFVIGISFVWYTEK